MIYLTSNSTKILCLIGTLVLLVSGVRANQCNCGCNETQTIMRKGPYNINIKILISFTSSFSNNETNEENSGPVCSANQVTYTSLCTLDCANGTLASYGPCKLDPNKCSTCSYDNKPVCANDGSSYPNACDFECARYINQDLNLAIVYERSCDDCY